MFKILDRGIRSTCKITSKKQQHGKDKQKRMIEFEIKDIPRQVHDVQKIIKELEEKSFAFAEDGEKKKDLSLLSEKNSFKRKAEETK